MAVAFDNSVSVVETRATTGTSSTTGAFTISGSATLAVAVVELSVGNSIADTAITGTGTFTLGGSTMVHLGSALRHSGAPTGSGVGTDTAGWVDIYYVISPPTGSQTATWAPTYVGLAGFMLSTLIVTTWTGTATTAPFGTPQLNGGELVASVTVGDSLASGDAFLAICCNGSANPGVTTGTSIAAPTGSADSASHFTRAAYNTGSGTVNVVFSTNSGDWSGATGVKILQPAAGGGFIAPDPLVVPPLQAVRRASYY